MKLGFGPERERGAIATIVTILLAGGVLVGALAIAVDVGNLMWERRQLQNAADAAAFSLAQSCAEAGSCAPGVNGIGSLVNANSADRLSGFETTKYPQGQCGHNVVGLPECDPPTGTLTDCPALPAGMGARVPYVEAHTKTLSNSSTVRQWFAGLLGASSDNKVVACARVAFGVPKAAQAPMTFSTCEWYYNTSNGTNYYPYDPPYGGSGNPLPTPASGRERVIYLQDHGSSVPCSNFNGHDVPGGFGYLNNASCISTVNDGGWVQVDTGNSISACDFSKYVNKVLYLPVFDCVIRSLSEPTGPVPDPLPTADYCNYGTGNNTWYHIKGWAKFYMSGYKVGGGGGNPPTEWPSSVTGTVPCTGGDRCISGWFLDGKLVDVPPSDLGGPPSDNPYDTYSIVGAG